MLSTPKQIVIECEDGRSGDAAVELRHTAEGQEVWLSAVHSCPKYIRLHWTHTFSPGARFCGDAWERTYADSEWRPMDGGRVMPWYFLSLDGPTISAFGVMTQPASFVGWRVTEDEIIAELDVRCGGSGVELRGRELKAAVLLSRAYTGSPYAALCDFCTRMCPSPLLPHQPVYGGNNWYYAYGHSSREEILRDTDLQAELAEGLVHRPFMVIDSCWEKISHSAPWVGRESFGDMGEVASAIRARDVRPGIWVRYLIDKTDGVPESWRLRCPFEREYNMPSPLDPSIPEVLDRITQITRQLRGYGFELIKHDFTTYDLFVNWCGGLSRITRDGWSFADRTRTSAEIVAALYKTILDAAEGALILGCNTISHLSAGLVHLSRIGDDTSGYDWARTREYGVNALAFRLAHHGRFYAADADCVGIIPGKIPWELNRQWLRLLSRSGTPLFLSCAKETLTPEQRAEVKTAYRYASVQSDILEPLDWTETRLPKHWRLQSGEILDFAWEV